MGVCSTKSKKKSSKEIRNDTQAIGSNTNNNSKPHYLFWIGTEIPQDRRNEDRENQRARLSNLLIPVPRTGYTGNISPRYEVDNDNYLNVNISINDEFSNRLPIVTNRYIAGRINHVVGTPNLTGAGNPLSKFDRKHYHLHTLSSGVYKS